MKNTKQKITALYCRLSRDDELKITGAGLYYARLNGQNSATRSIAYNGTVEKYLVKQSLILIK